MYWLGVGMLLYPKKHLQQNIANATRELSKVNNGASPAVFMELLCVIKHALNKRNLELKIEQIWNADKPWEIVCFSDSDNVRDWVSGRCICDFILYILDILVSW